MELNGAKALVTGGAVRVGRGICEALAEQGADVVVHYRSSSQEAEELCESLRKLGRKACALQADLSVEGDCESLVQRASEKAGGLDILVNNASVFRRDSIKELTVPGMTEQLQVNLFAPMILMRCFAEVSGAGKIVNLLDARIAGYDASHVSYGWSKKGLADLTLLAAREWAPSITVNAVAPGPVLPPTGKDGSYLREKAGFTPLGKPCSVEEVASAVLFLMRNDAITGQVVYVDGGQHLVEAR